MLLYFYKYNILVFNYCMVFNISLLLSVYCFGYFVVKIYKSSISL